MDFVFTVALVLLVVASLCIGHKIGYNVGWHECSDAYHLMETKPNPDAWKDAADVLSLVCDGAEGCDERCPMFAWCERNLPDDMPSLPPNAWRYTEED